MPPKVQLPQLHFSRLIAASFVVIFHFGLGSWPFRHPDLQPVFQNGGLAVGFFFCLSGFLLALGYRNANQPFPYLTYFRSRFARIFPLYFLAFLVTLFLIVFIQKEYPRGLSIILQALGIQAWIPGMSLAINFPGWSVSVEIFFYALVPLLVFLLQKRGLFRIWLFALFLWMSSGVAQVTLVNYPGNPFPEFGDFVLRFPLLHLNAFVIGFAGGAGFQQNPAFPKYLPVFMVMGGITLVLTSILWFEPMTHYGTNGLYAPAWLLIILGLSLDRTFLSRLLSRPGFVQAGEMSYAVYLLQCPVMIGYSKAMGIPPNQALTSTQFWLYFGILVVLSYLSYRFFEAPMRSWIRGNQAQ